MPYLILLGIVIWLLFKVWPLLLAGFVGMVGAEFIGSRKRVALPCLAVGLAGLAGAAWFGYGARSVTPQQALSLGSGTLVTMASASPDWSGQVLKWSSDRHGADCSTNTPENPHRLAVPELLRDRRRWLGDFVEVSAAFSQELYKMVQYRTTNGVRQAESQLNSPFVMPVMGTGGALWILSEDTLESLESPTARQFMMAGRHAGRLVPLKDLSEYIGSEDAYEQIESTYGSQLPEMALALIPAANYREHEVWVPLGGTENRVWVGQLDEAARTLPATLVTAEVDAMRDAHPNLKDARQFLFAASGRPELGASSRWYRFLLFGVPSLALLIAGVAGLVRRPPVVVPVTLPDPDLPGRT